MTRRGPIVAPVLSRFSRGMTLVELMIGLAILAFLMMSGAPAFSEWIRNAQIRTASESILNGIQFARTEAVRRNTTTRFQMTSALDNGCALSTTGRNWVVNMIKSQSPETKCDAALVENDAKKDKAPFLLQRSALTSANSSLVIDMQSDSASPVIAFNGLGQQTSVSGQQPGNFTITVSSSQGRCVEAGGTVRCLRLVVGRDGQARLCDPGIVKSNTTQPAGCQSS